MLSYTKTHRDTHIHTHTHTPSTLTQYITTRSNLPLPALLVSTNTIYFITSRDSSVPVPRDASARRIRNRDRHLFVRRCPVRAPLGSAGTKSYRGGFNNPLEVFAPSVPFFFRLFLFCLLLSEEGLREILFSFILSPIQIQHFLKSPSLTLTHSLTQSHTHTHKHVYDELHTGCASSRVEGMAQVPH